MKFVHEASLSLNRYILLSYWHSLWNWRSIVKLLDQDQQLWMSWSKKRSMDYC